MVDLEERVNELEKRVTELEGIDKKPFETQGGKLDNSKNILDIPSDMIEKIITQSWRAFTNCSKNI